ncbi:MAG: kinase [Thermoplasmata archaeon]|nr:kinase [Thermoplasmata archaeon]
MGKYKLITTRTPLRITFTGGGTDIPAYYRRYGPGAVVSATINKYIYVTVAKNFYKDEIRVSYSKTENAIKDVEDIEHPTVREALKLLNIKSGIQIVSITEIPSRGTGLGSSSSFLVGLLNALHAWKGEAASAKQLAEEAIKIEREILKEPGGKQDQYMAAYGGIQLMEFFPDESVNLKKFNIEKCSNNLDQKFVLLYTGIERDGTKIHSVQRNYVDEKVLDYNKARDFAYELFSLLEKCDFGNLAKIMHENWMLKKNFSPGITNDSIENIYEIAKKSGSLGGKLQGAGGGGFFLLYTDNKEKLKENLSNFIVLDFKFDLSGSKITYYENE